MANAKLKDFDDIFKSSQQREQNGKNGISTLPLSELQPFSKHPFKKHNAEKMQELADSIVERGVISTCACKIIGQR